MTILNLKSVDKFFRQGDQKIQVLNGLNLQLQKGETLAVLGPSGSGKSTLLSLIAGLDKPSAGQIWVDGQDLNILDEQALTRFRAQKLGIVFQQFHLFSYLNAVENIALPLEIQGDPAAMDKAYEALKAVGLSHRDQHFPYQLSGGECQRVAIARAFVVKPSLLLADEPSGSLDTKTGEHVMDVLFDMAKSEKSTLVLVTHNEHLAGRCQKEFRFS